MALMRSVRGLVDTVAPSLLLAALVAISGCSAHDPTAHLSATPVVSKRTIPTNELECRQRGGNWSQQGLGEGPKVCDLKTKDYRKSCSDSSQCEGACMAATPDVAATKPRGFCSEYVRQYGCVSILKNGEMESPCYD